MEWKPIESTPKDGRSILLLAKLPSGEIECYVARWIDYYNSLEWHIVGVEGVDSEIYYKDHLTHWMSLPETPKE
ncbi:DUF551 domain-containing protein [Dyadobacter sandarakinus]|uniref:DUF551 domain-containing protein n=1 Tax=Dyadobacter sandarakinus TaxID=2747268 RepID=A0ABX7I0Z6_9BACT|nr:DUF551 domain-containing protein [Dyadobacter sandarakinus]